MITWDVGPEIFTATLPIIGEFSPRWYSIAFIIGFGLGEKYVGKVLGKYFGFDEKLTSKLLIYMLVGTFIGARLGHVLFYDPAYYLSNPLQILMIWQGGLASHGGYAGVIIAIFMFIKKYKGISFLQILDVAVTPALWTGGLIRLGNLMNSEIIGSPTDVPWAFVFRRIDLVPRHPAQIYESIGYFSVAIILHILVKTKFETWNSGRIFGIAIFLSFSFRLFIEQFKNIQVAFEQGMFLNMGQLLSIPFIIVGALMAFNLVKLPANNIPKH